jgi:DNA-binding NtrC family response regulator
VFDEIRSVAPTNATVLVLGDTGTGKELVARAIHDGSQRADKPYISVNCGAFSESLLESELFGHEQGSFTGAVGRRDGVFSMADGGTLFLDELGRTSLNVQVNLLRVLEEMAFRRVGGEKLVNVDVRIVAATNVQLAQAVEEGAFREDLYYRLNVFPIRLPPLRERREDIPLLLRHFLDSAAREYGLTPPRVAADAMAWIVDFDWPGNVRQLRALCERWVIVAQGRTLLKEMLPRELVRGRRIAPEEMADLGLDDSLPLLPQLQRIQQQVESAYLHKVLVRCDGHLQNAAKHAGISRRTLYNKMKAYDLDPSAYRVERR